MSIEKTIDHKTIYRGKIIDLIIKDVRLENNKLAKREVALHKPGVSVIALEGEHIFLVKQFRTAIEKEIFEIPAGLVEENETILEAAHRELQEEIGYDAKVMEQLTSFYPSPGFTNEITHIFLAKDLFKSKLPEDEDEQLQVYPFPISKLEDFIKEEKIIDAKTLIAISLFLLYEKKPVRN